VASHSILYRFTMNPSGLHAYVPLLIHLLVAAILAALFIAISTFIGWRRPNQAKQQPYECGITPTGDAREPFSVKFYLVAMVFILFDVSLPVGVHLQRFGSQCRNAVVWLHRNDVLCRHPVGWIHLSLEEGRAGLA